MFRRITDRSTRGAELQTVVDEGTPDGGEWRPNQLQDSFNSVVQKVCQLVSQSDLENRAKAPTVESMHMVGSSVASSHAAPPITVEDDDALATNPDEDDCETDIAGFSLSGHSKAPTSG